MPATRREFWETKFCANVARDGRNRQDLLDSKWRVAVVWECALRGRGRFETALALDRWLRGNDSTFETALSVAGYSRLETVVPRVAEGAKKFNTD